MPSRPRTHELESESLLALQGNLPSAWLFRPEHPDYGIDGSIEVFSDAGATTGLRFLVQVKSTDRQVKSPSVRLRADTGDYYRSLDQSVLIVLYQAPTKKLFARWFHEFDPYYGGSGKKWLTFRFHGDCLWTSATAPRIKKDLETERVLRSSSLPLPIPFDIRLEGEAVGGLRSGRVKAALRRRLTSYDSIFQESDDGVLWVRATNEATVVSLRGSMTATMHTRGRSLELDDYVSNVVVLAALVLGQAGDHNLASSLAVDVAGRSQMLRDPEVCTRIAGSMVRAQRLNEALDLASQLSGDEKSSLAADILTLASMQSIHPGADPEKLEEHLRNRIALAEESDDAVGQGVANYNLGNRLRGKGRHREAFHYYRAAARCHPVYLARDYFQREVASLLFSLGRYHASSRCYRRAIELGGPKVWLPLLADALLHSGQFEQASAIFAEYLKEKTEPAAEWLLKAWAIETIQKFCTSAQRNSREAQCAAARWEVGPPPSYEEVVQVLALDGLCVPAWLQLAAVDHASVDETLRGAATTIAAVLFRNDSILWAQAFVFATGNPELREHLTFVVCAALEAVEQEFLPAVDRFMGSIDLDEGEVDRMHEVLSDIESTFNKTRRRDHFEIRIAGENAEYEAFVLPHASPTVQWGAKMHDTDSPDI